MSGLGKPVVEWKSFRGNLQGVVVVFNELTISLSQLFENNFGINKCRLELENYCSLIGL